MAPVCYAEKKDRIALETRNSQYSTANEHNHQRRMTSQTDLFCAQHHAVNKRSAIIETSSFRPEIKRQDWGYETTVQKAILHMYSQCA
jgi:hypothetical protein